MTADGVEHKRIKCMIIFTTKSSVLLEKISSSSTNRELDINGVRKIRENEILLIINSLLVTM